MSMKGFDALTAAFTFPDVDDAVRWQFSTRRFHPGGPLHVDPHALRRPKPEGDACMRRRGVSCGRRHGPHLSTDRDARADAVAIAARAGESNDQPVVVGRALVA